MSIPSNEGRERMDMETLECYGFCVIRRHVAETHQKFKIKWNSPAQVAEQSPTGFRDPKSGHTRNTWSTFVPFEVSSWRRLMLTTMRVMWLSESKLMRDALALVRQYCKSKKEWCSRSNWRPSPVLERHTMLLMFAHVFCRKPYLSEWMILSRRNQHSHFCVRGNISPLFP